MKILKVQDGSSPNPNSTSYTDPDGPAVVICRGDTYNLWINHRTSETLGQTELTEGEAMAFGLAANPGTPDSMYQSTIESEVQSRFGVDLTQRDIPDGAVEGVPPGPPDTVSDVLSNTPNRVPSDEDFQRPWDIEPWNSPAGEPPKRTPIYEVDQTNNR